MQRVVDGREAIIQPVHWLLEVGAVLTLLNPAGAEEDIAMLQAMDFEVVDDPLIWRRASRLAIDLNQRLFDTIYHALALETRDAVLVTANTRYMKSGFALDGMVSLAVWANA